MNIKAFMVLMLFVLLFAMLAGGVMGNTDLTPDTPPVFSDNAQSAAGAPIAAPFDAGRSALLDNACGSVYQVQGGDTLSSIAARCGVTLQEVIAVNPGIANPHMISIGQQINMPAGASAAAVPPTGAAVLPTPTSLFTSPQQSAFTSTESAPAQPAAVASFQTYVPGQTITAEINHLPVNTEVMIGIGPAGSAEHPGGPYRSVMNATSDAQGKVIVDVRLPSDAPVGEEWVVMAIPLNSSGPVVERLATPFLIVAP